MGRRWWFIFLVLELEDPVVRSIRMSDQQGLRANKTFSCDDGKSFSLNAVEDPALKAWFTEMFSKTKGERLGVGRDTDSSVGYYNRLRVRGAWAVRSDKDAARFSVSQQRTTSKDEDRDRRNGIDMLSTEMQSLTNYPRTILDSSAREGTYLVHGTNPQALKPIMCNGLRPGRDGLMGAAVYLADLAAKADQYCGRDCSKNPDGTCTYVIDTLEATTGRGFPIEGEFEEVDRKRPMNYMFVVLAAPFRIARNYIAKNSIKKGRQNWNFWIQPSSAGANRSSWLQYEYDRRSKGFNNPASAKAWQQEYEFTQLLAKSPHRQETGWFLNEPNLAAPNGRHDEYIVPDAQYTKLAFLVAYQRLCLGSRCPRQNETVMSSELIPPMPNELTDKELSSGNVNILDPRQQNEVDVLGFYHPGHPTAVDELSGVGYLGNFWKLPQPFKFAPPGKEPISFTNAEAAFHACKFWKSGHHLKFENVDAGKSFRLKKEVGKLLAQEGKKEDFSFGGFGSNWKAMRAILKIKFDPTINADLANKLIATGDAFLLEHDDTVRQASVWGSNKDGSGTNWLGAMLMLIRDQLTSKDTTSPSSWSHFIGVRLDGRTGPKQPAWRNMVKRASEAINRATDQMGKGNRKDGRRNRKRE